MKQITLALFVLLLAGCPCDVSAQCRIDAAEALRQATIAASVASAPITTASPAGQAAQGVLRDPLATQERKAQALQLLFELERNERLADTVKRLDELTAKLEVVLERKVEAESR